MTGDNPLRGLPRVDDLVEEHRGALPDAVLLTTVRNGLDEARKRIGDGESLDPRQVVERAIERLRLSSTAAVVNATGVLLHTNLGRARWSPRAVAAATRAAESTTNLEIDVKTGKRSRRGAYVTELLKTLTGAEDAMVVSNNASALVIALAATSGGLSVPVARGELIEIGGSYRLPDVMAVSGTNLVEVGTTNRVRPGDYMTAAQLHRVGAFLKVHPSNFRVEGFTSAVPTRDLAQMASEWAVPLIHDIGSGLLDSETPWLEGATPDFLLDEPAARQTVEDGAGLVTFSGDKLLGGPQAGLIVGTAENIRLLRSHPLARALRVDGVTLAALEATLEAYASNSASEIPFWAQATASIETLIERSQRFAGDVDGTVVNGSSTVGGGSVPSQAIPGPNVVIEGRDDLYECLLASDRPILTRRENGDLVVDLRTVDEPDDAYVVGVIKQCL